MFPLMQGGRGTEGMVIPGGRFSLGRLSDGSGYCVGAVVETRMGVGDERDGAAGNARGRTGTAAGNGMKDVWVIGEGFFRGVGAVFDVSILLRCFMTCTDTTAFGTTVPRPKSRVPYLLTSSPPLFFFAILLSPHHMAQDHITAHVKSHFVAKGTVFLIIVK